MAISSQREHLKTERLEARVTPEDKERFTRAAELTGRSLTDFLLANLHEATRRILDQHNVTLLSATDSQRVVDSLLNTPEPNDALRRAAARFLEVRSNTAGA
ncbi:MAG: DUF1778 domain-containing protein [Candidatus Dormibacteraeota bacterium]|nr:DUF1778 domain-containing protein [Candidatus Dormibacteraeota bacterium]